MLDAFKALFANQFEAALCTLNTCVDRCPEASWDARVGNLAFCQVAFHVLFFADYYLGSDEASFRGQAFHRDNLQFFRDYEELEDRPQKLLYDRPSIVKYLQHCRTKAQDRVVSETLESLAAPCGFEWRNFSRAELHVYNIRHIQHHAAQMSLRLRLDAGRDIPWIGTGWKNVAAVQGG